MRGTSGAPSRTSRDEEEPRFHARGADGRHRDRGGVGRHRDCRLPVHPQFVEGLGSATDGQRDSRGAGGVSRRDAELCGRVGLRNVDAAMAQINQTGYMHNRLRMVAGELSGERPGY